MVDCSRLDEYFIDGSLGQTITSNNALSVKTITDKAKNGWESKPQLNINNYDLKFKHNFMMNSIYTEGTTKKPLPYWTVIPVKAKTSGVPNDLKSTCTATVTKTDSLGYSHQLLVIEGSNNGPFSLKTK